MSSENVTYIELTKDNIRSFDDYIPPAVAVRILRENVSGWGAVEGDLVSGLVLCERDHKNNRLWILWLYVDEEIRGQGVGGTLYEKAAASMEEPDAVLCRYLFPAHGMLDAFLEKKGFTVRTESEYEGESKTKVHLAMKGRAVPEEQNPDAWAVANVPDMSRALPRLMALLSYLEHAGMKGEISALAGVAPIILARDDEDTPGFMVMVTDEGGDTENYVVVLRTEIELEEEEAKEIAEELAVWERHFRIVSGQVDFDDDILIFTASMPVDDDGPNRAMFNDFVEEFLEESGRFLEAMSEDE